MAARTYPERVALLKAKMHIICCATGKPGSKIEDLAQYISGVNREDVPAMVDFASTVFERPGGLLRVVRRTQGEAEGMVDECIDRMDVDGVGLCFALMEEGRRDARIRALRASNHAIAGHLVAIGFTE